MHETTATVLMPVIVEYESYPALPAQGDGSGGPPISPAESERIEIRSVRVPGDDRSVLALLTKESIESLYLQLAD